MSDKTKKVPKKQNKSIKSSNKSGVTTKKKSHQEKENEDKHSSSDWDRLIHDKSLWCMLLLLLLFAVVAGIVGRILAGLL